MQRPWFAIIWFTWWGLFQAYAVAALFRGTWERPEAFPEEAYNAFIFPDLVFIPLYLAAAVLLFQKHWLGPVFGLITGGAVIYALVYLFALAGFEGAVNLIWDSVFLVMSMIAVVQVVGRLRPKLN